MFTQAPGYLESNAVFGNPDIENIKSVHGSLGIKHTFSDGWSVKSEVFYKALDNLVTSDDVLNYTNDGEGKTYGFDTLVRKNLTEKLSGWLSVSLSESRREDTRSGESFVFDYDQPFNVSLVGSYKINDKWTIGTKLWAHSGTPYTPVTGAQEDENTPGFFIPEYAAINSARLPSYQRLDVRVDRAFKTNKGRKINAWFELLNVLGKENAASYDYNSDYTEREIVPQLEGLFSMGFKASF
jgi:outer membrane receptor for monomeric catechols